MRGSSRLRMGVVALLVFPVAVANAAMALWAIPQLFDPPTSVVTPDPSEVWVGFLGVLLYGAQSGGLVSAVVGLSEARGVFRWVLGVGVTLFGVLVLLFMVASHSILIPASTEYSPTIMSVSLVGQAAFAGAIGVALVASGAAAVAFPTRLRVVGSALASLAWLAGAVLGSVAILLRAIVRKEMWGEYFNASDVMTYVYAANSVACLALAGVFVWSIFDRSAPAEDPVEAGEVE